MPHSPGYCVWGSVDATGRDGIKRTRDNRIWHKHNALVHLRLLALACFFPTCSDALALPICNLSCSTRNDATDASRRFPLKQRRQNQSTCGHSCPAPASTPFLFFISAPNLSVVNITSLISRKTFEESSTHTETPSSQDPWLHYTTICLTTV